MDLQLAYLAGPQNAAQVSSAQTAPQAAQAAAQAAFVAEVQKREETIEETQHAKGNVIRTNSEGQSSGGGYTPGDRRRRSPHDGAPDDTSPLGLAGDGEHFIDVTA